MNANWSRRLVSAYRDTTGERHKVRLPDAKSFVVSGNDGNAHVHLLVAAVVGNMQTNAAAFESWCLALHRWCGAKVELSWELPDDSDNQHYQRFLFRLQWFHSLFGDNWFSYKDPHNALAWSRVLKAADGLWLNVGGSVAKVQKVRPSDVRRWSEDHWECHLARPEVRWLEDTFGLRSQAVKEQQFPVGLFTNAKPSKASAVFPGAKSAIDLLALDGTGLWIFELKKSGNVGFGALSELLFYAAVMRDVAVGKFDFADPKGHTRSKISRGAIRDITEIEAVLLTPKPHPLIDGELLKMLNEASRTRWNESAPSVNFRLHQFDPEEWSSLG